MTQLNYSPCSACHKRCCHVYRVTVTGYDAWLIATSLQFGMEQFLVYFPTDDADPSHFKLDHSETRFDIALAKQEAAGDEKPCAFWLPLRGGYGRCGIYPFRPLVCQNYPAYLDRGIVQLRTDVLCPERSWNLSSMDLPFWRRRLLRYQMESDIYCCVVEQWNAFVESSPPQASFPINVYYGYLTAIYHRLELVRRSISAQEEEPILRRWGACADNRINPLARRAEEDNEKSDPRWIELLSNFRWTIENFFVGDNPRGSIRDTEAARTPSRA